jgi:hypothetical protein
LAATRGGVGAGAVVSGLAGGQGIGPSLLAGLNVAFPEAGAFADAAVLAGGLGYKALAAAMGGPLAADLQKLNAPTSVSEAVAGLKATAKKRADSIHGLLPFAKAMLGGRTIGEAEDKQIADNEAALIRQAAQSSPELASAMVRAMGSPANLVKALNDELVKQARAAQSKAFLSGLSGGGGVTGYGPQQTVVNFNTGVLGSTQDAMTALQRVARNNGQSTVITAPRTP